MTTNGNGRLLIVANRLPVTVAPDGDQYTLVPSNGGLATGLSGLHDRGEGLWFGWPGPTHRLRRAARRQVPAALRERRLVAIELSATELEQYYNSFANGVLWPTFHYSIDRLPLDNDDWPHYAAVNERFAAAVAAEWREGDLIWVHDYHLMLVPQLLRQRLPQARIGFFLHIPFPACDVFRVLPCRSELLTGLLGADLIGFHTLGYLRHFASSLLRILGIEANIDRLAHDGREVRLAAYPLGVDFDRFDALANDPAILQQTQNTIAESRGARIVLGVDRLDYTKGIRRRLLAFERMLESGKVTGKVQLIQVAATSRGDVSAYRSFKSTVDEMVGRINGRFGTPDYTPIRYINRGLDQREVVALYRAADVMLVTPLRDGLNLVAKEFVASRPDLDGVLMLSEFAGAAAELPDAVVVNPYDVASVAATLASALEMPAASRRRRMQTMRAYVARTDTQHWTSAFLGDLAATSSPATRTGSSGYEQALAAVQAVAQGNDRLCLFLDYDGTLVPFYQRPDLASPDAELLQLLTALAARAGTEVHLLSGRAQQSLDEWFGELPIGLHAEHGAASRAPTERSWSLVPGLGTEWKPQVLGLLHRVAAHVPGSFVEDKLTSVTWHYRQVDPAFASTVAKELQLNLLELLSNVGVQVVPGNRVLEVRQQNVHKGTIVTAIRGAYPGCRSILLGDDRTDEDMFLAAGEGDVTVHVGPGVTAARFVVRDHLAARALLAELVTRPPESPSRALNAVTSRQPGPLPRAPGRA
ncbi:MAG TPA: bifunctional alpha,alpha-trehalose-phosphate synthase (UDP-forming)/trehalose-phosphatase [Planctomycetota bacterium]|nr:bifunctional alpha,alpha-trehalose-phosphate synthase (UDP-forming)/trehalose-phosphatase [Planctomycetota bacterium]